MLAQTLAKAIEEAMDPAPADQHKSGFGSSENDGIGRYFPRRLAESEGEEEMIERTKHGEDLAQLE
jgi:hypothetical protein